MKRIIVIIAIVATLYGISPLRQSFGYAWWNFNSGMQVANLDGSTATVSILIYNSSGGFQTSILDTINAGASKTYFALSSLPNGFQGSITAVSNKKIASVVNNARISGTARASYTAPRTGSTQIKLPLLLRNHGTSNSSTWFVVQNVGASAANFSVSYSDGTSNGYAGVQPGASVGFDQQTEYHPASSFAATVSSLNQQPLAITVFQENSAALFTYSGFSPDVIAIYPELPLINVQPAKAYATGIQVQNTGFYATQVTIAYTPTPGGSNGTACTETQTIQPGQSNNFALSAFANGSVPGGTTTCQAGQKLVGSARVTSNTNLEYLAAIVNQTLPGSGSSYNGFNSSSATDRLVFPLIKAQFGSSQANTGFNVMNVSQYVTFVSCIFSNSPFSIGATLNPGEALNAVQNATQLGAGYIGAATCTGYAYGGGPAKIIGVINESASVGSGDKLQTSEGLNSY